MGRRETVTPEAVCGLVSEIHSPRLPKGSCARWLCFPGLLGSYRLVWQEGHPQWNAHDLGHLISGTPGPALMNGFPLAAQGSPSRLRPRLTAGLGHPGPEGSLAGGESADTRLSPGGPAVSL